MAKTVGIDLGTTNSVVAVMEGGEPVVIANAEGGRTTPSVVAFTRTGERLVGQLARRQAAVNPENTVYSIKRFMGRLLSEVEQRGEAGALQGRGRARTAAPRWRSAASDITPEQISAMILQKLKTDAEAYLGEKVTDAVITVPAYFNDAQRQATKNAGQIAGLNVLRIINEPTAAALAYGLEKKENEKILVFDLGGGTFDVSILEVGEGVFEVKSTNGDTHLGGDDYDRRIVDWLADEFKSDQGIDLRSDRQALQRLTEAAEKAKIELSQRQETEVNLPFITADASGPKHLAITLSRSKFEQLTDDLTSRCRGPFEAALKDAGMNAHELDEVILVGGSTRMPVIQELVKSFTDKDPHRGVNPDEVVAVGAAIQAGVLKGEVKDVLLLDVTPLSLGIMTEGEVNTKLIERNTTIPTAKTQVFSTASDSQPSVEIVVLQGERPMARDNRILGTFTLDGIAPAPRGHAADRGRIRHRCQRHPQCQRQGSRHRQGEQGHHHRFDDPPEGRGRAHGEGGRGPRRRGPQARGSRRDEEPRRPARLPGREGARRTPATRCLRSCAPTSRARSRRFVTRLPATTPTRSSARTTTSPRRSRRSARRCTPSRSSHSPVRVHRTRATATAAPRIRVPATAAARTTSSTPSSKRSNQPGTIPAAPAHARRRRCSPPARTSVSSWWRSRCPSVRSPRRRTTRTCCCCPRPFPST